MAPRSKQYRRKRAYRKRKGGRKQRSVLVNTATQPIPQRYICKQRYAETITTDVNGQYQFRLNSVFDPNYTGVGQQYLFRDQLVTMYNRYRVISASWRIHATGSTTQGLQLGVVPSNGDLASAPTSVDAIKEMPRGKYAIIAATQTGMVKGKVHLPSFTGKSTQQYMSDDSYASLTTGNPTEVMYLNIITGGQTSGNVASFAGISVVLDIVCEYYDPIVVARS